MEHFSAEWLARREPADHAARSAALVESLAADWGAVRGLHAMDLGSGAGSNVRYLLSRLPQVSRWTLVDHDAALLEHAVRRLAPEASARGVVLEAVVHDLSDLATLMFDGVRLVTASALLDLAGDAWLASCAARCAEVGADALFALTYDGRWSCDPADATDERVRALVNAHQRRPKGLGMAACGPSATARAVGHWAAAGYAVDTVQTDWRLGPEEATLQRPLVEGWASAACDEDPAARAAIERWRAQRVAEIATGRLWIRVGHHDLLARRGRDVR